MQNLKEALKRTVTLNESGRDVIPVFNKVEALMPEKTIEKLFLANYDDVVPGTVKIEKKLKPTTGGSFVNVTIDKKDGGVRYGDVTVALDVNNPRAIRVRARLSIDD